MSSPDIALIQAAGQLIRAMAPVRLRARKINDTICWAADAHPDSTRVHAAIDAGIVPLNTLARELIDHRASDGSFLIAGTQHGIDLLPVFLAEPEGDIDWDAVNAAVNAARRAHLQWVRGKQLHRSASQMLDRAFVFADALGPRELTAAVPVVMTGSGVAHAVVLSDAMMTLFGLPSGDWQERSANRDIAADVLTLYAHALLRSTPAAREAAAAAVDRATGHSPFVAFPEIAPTPATVGRYLRMGTLLVDPGDTVRLVDEHGDELARM